ncbi:MAG: ferredoxin [Chloroflexi bacterium]|nr:ferredoxin [Chloroflexota bacterium]
MKVMVDRQKCIGAANCVAAAPGVFQIDDAGKARVLDPSSVAEDRLLEAAESCPTDAIVLEDDAGRRLYP